MIGVAGSFLIREGHDDEALVGILEAQRLSREEPGLLFYQAHRSPTEPRRFYVYEQWADEESLKAHSRTEHFRRIILKQVLPLIEERESQTYTAIEAGA